MEVNLEQSNPCVMRITGNFTPEEVTRKYRQLIDELKKNVYFPGFRPGRVPDSIIFARFGDAFWDELARRMITEVIEDAENKYERIREESLYLGDPKFEKPDPKKPFIVEIDVEFPPIVELKKYSDFELVRPRIDIPPEEVDREIEAFRIRNAKLEPRNRPAQKNDYVEVGIIIGDAQSPTSHLIPLDDPEFSQFFGELTGKSAGESLSLEREFPQNFPDRRLRGFSGKLDLTVKNVYEQKIPELDSEFFKSIGKPEGYTLADFRKEVEGFLSLRMTLQSKEELREQVITKLIEENPVDVPPHYLESRIENYIHNHFSIKQMDADLLGKLKDSVKNKVLRDVKFEFIAKKIIEVEKIEATEAEIKDQLEKAASAIGADKKSTEKLTEKDQLYSLVRQAVLNEKVLDFVMARCKINELDVIRDIPSGPDVNTEEKKQAEQHSNGSEDDDQST